MHSDDKSARLNALRSIDRYSECPSPSEAVSRYYALRSDADRAEDPDSDDAGSHLNGLCAGCSSSPSRYSVDYSFRPNDFRFDGGLSSDRHSSNEGSRPNDVCSYGPTSQDRGADDGRSRPNDVCSDHHFESRRPEALDHLNKLRADGLSSANSAADDSGAYDRELRADDPSKQDLDSVDRFARLNELYPDRGRSPTGRPSDESSCPKSTRSFNR